MDDFGTLVILVGAFVSATVISLLVVAWKWRGDIEDNKRVELAETLKTATPNGLLYCFPMEEDTQERITKVKRPVEVCSSCGRGGKYHAEGACLGCGAPVEMEEFVEFIKERAPGKYEQEQLEDGRRIIRKVGESQRPASYPPGYASYAPDLPRWNLNASESGYIDTVTGNTSDLWVTTST